jgi:hypothetical protein
MGYSSEIRNEECPQMLVLKTKTSKDLCKGKRMLLRMLSFGMLRGVAVATNDVSEELSASIIKVTRIDELETLAGTSNRFTLRYDPTKR